MSDGIENFGEIGPTFFNDSFLPRIVFIGLFTGIRRKEIVQTLSVYVDEY